MPVSETRVPSSGIYVPAASDSPSFFDSSSPLKDYVETTIEGLEDYARREPLKFAGWVFGIGFVLGWKLKPW